MTNYLEENEKGKWGEFMHRAFILFALCVVVAVFIPGILPEQKPEKSIPTAFSIEKQAEKEELMYLERQLLDTLADLEILEKREKNGDETASAEAAYLRENIRQLRARIDSARDSP